ncbi:TPA: hypothetical protein DDW35_04745 [Candidatus Sumerlaeota bacterium]|nr:hypothetical protein [Candidatus Sumerlaeota bacterium]
MRLSAALTLSRISFRTHWKTWLWIIAGMGIGTLALGISIFAGLGVSKSLKNHLNAIFPENRVIIQPKMVDVQVLRVETSTITEDTLRQVRALPGVKRISPEATLRFPVSASATLWGNTYTTDITVTGVEPWLLGNDVPTTFTYNPETDTQVPAILAAYFLDLYNLALAEGNKLPKLAPAAVLNREFDLVLGSSSIHPAKADGKMLVITGKVCALSRNPDLLGLLIPLSAVESFNKWYGLPMATYRRLHVELDSITALDALRPKLDAMKLEAVDPAGLWRRLAAFLDLIGLGFAALGALVFVLAMAYLLASVSWMLARRQRERAMFLTLGCSRRELTILMTGETAVLSGIGIALGLGLSVALFHLANIWYHAWRADRTYLPTELFAAPWSWVIAIGFICWGIAILFPGYRIHRESRETPIVALTEAEMR